MNAFAIGQLRPDSREKIKSALEILSVTAITISLLLILSKSNLFSPDSKYQQSIALAIWIYIPTIVILIHGRKFEEYGITLKGWKNSLLLTSITLLIVYPPYFIVFYLFEIFSKSATFQLTLSQSFLTRFVFLTLFISLPEEYFFRGYLQTELNRLLGKKYRLFGVNFGFGLILSAILFGFVHYLFGAGWSGLLTMFAALLFGWLREQTGGILAPTLFHGFGNIIYVTLVESFQVKMITFQSYM